MLSILKEFPDWTTGALLGGVAWFGVSYGLLAPRAMKHDLESDVYPACVDALREDEGIAIDRIVKRRIQNAEYDLRQKRDQLTSRVTELSESRRELEAYHAMRQALCGSGICDLVPFAPPLPDFSVHDIDAEIASLRSELASLVVPHISIPKVPRAELMESCACAVSTAITGKQTSYALSLASFRVFSPADAESLKHDVAQAINLDVCGKPSWRKL